MGVQHSIAVEPRRRGLEYTDRPDGRRVGRGFAIALTTLGLALALVQVAPAGAAGSNGAKPYDVQNGVRIYRGPDFTTSFEPAPAPRQRQAEPADRGPAAILDPMVEIPIQPSIKHAGYRLRCPSVESNTCALSQVFVEVLNQPVMRRTEFRPGKLVRIGTEIRDGKLVPVARVTQRGVTVHRAGLRDDLRILVHRAGTREDRDIRVIRAGVSSDRNIIVRRAGVRDDRNIRVHRAGVRNNANIRVHGPGG